MTSVNGGIDENPSNDMLSTDFEFTDGDGVVLNMETGGGGGFGGLTLDIVDPSGNVIITEDDFGGNEVYAFPICLSPGCFSLQFAYGGGGGGGGGNGLAVDFELVDGNGNILASGEEIPANGGGGGGGGNGGSLDVNYCTPNAEIAAYDVQLIEITEPNDAPICASTFTPSFEFVNLGSDTITTLDIEYTFNGETNNFTWTAQGQGAPQFGEREIVLPTLNSPGAGAYDFTVNIVSLNGQTDEDDTNNTVTTNLNFIAGQEVVVDIDPTGPPNPLVYTITNELGEIVIEVDNINNGDNIDNYCLEVGCYTFSMADPSGNSGAAFTVSNNLGDVLINNELVQDLIEVEFCVVPSDIAAIDIAISEINGIPAVQCNSTVAPIFTFLNNGLESVTSIEYEYIYDGNIMFNETWTGTINTAQTEEIQVEALTGLATGTHTLMINILGVNGQADTEIDNNTLTQNFIISPEPYFVLVQGENSVEVTYDGLEEPVSIEWIDGSTDAVFEYTDPSIVNVTVTDGNGCSSTQEIDLASGISSLPSTANIALYPNPANNQLFLSHTLPTGYTLNLKDVLGRTVYSQTIESDLVNIDLGDKITNGLYLVEITNGVEMGVYKILVIR